MAFQPFFRLLDTNGDGTGSTNAAQNFSATPTDFFIQTPTTQPLVITSYSINLSDTTGSFKLTEYGGLAALTNGISLITVIRGVTEVRWSGVKTNQEMLVRSSDPFFLHETNDLYLKFRVTFPENSGDFLRLDQAGDKLIFRLNDNFTGLNLHQFVARGLIST